MTLQQPPLKYDIKVTYTDGSVETWQNLNAYTLTATDLTFIHDGEIIMINRAGTRKIVIKAHE